MHTWENRCSVACIVIRCTQLTLTGVQSQESQSVAFYKHLSYRSCWLSVECGGQPSSFRVSTPQSFSEQMQNGTPTKYTREQFIETEKVLDAYQWLLHPRADITHEPCRFFFLVQVQVRNLKSWLKISNLQHVASDHLLTLDGDVHGLSVDNRGNPRYMNATNSGPLQWLELKSNSWKLMEKSQQTRHALRWPYLVRRLGQTVGQLG